MQAACCFGKQRPLVSRSQGIEKRESRPQRTSEALVIISTCCLNPLSGTLTRPCSPPVMRSSLSHRQLLPSLEVCTRNCAYDVSFSWPYYHPFTLSLNIFACLQKERSVSSRVLRFLMTHTTEAVFPVSPTTQVKKPNPLGGRAQRADE